MDRVLDLHSQTYPDREVESLQRKYMKSFQKKAPTGCPHLSKYMKLVKLVQHKIGKKVQFGGGNRVHNTNSDIFAARVDDKDYHVTNLLPPSDV